MILLLLIRGLGFLVLFGVYFVGQKAFSAGLAQERAGGVRPQG